MAEAQSKLELVIEVQGKQLDVLTQIASAIAGIDKKVTESNKNLADVVENTNGRLTKSLNSIKNGATEVLGAFGLWVTLPRLIGFAEDSLSRFTGKELSIAKLSGAVKIMHGDFDAMKPAIDATTEGLQKFGITTQQSNEGLAQLEIRGIVGKQALLGIAAAAKLIKLEPGDMSLSEGIHDLINASNGYLRPGSALGQLLGNLRDELQKGGTQSENFAKIMDRLGHLDPAVNAQLDTIANKTKTAGVAWNEFSTNVGQWLANKLELRENLTFVAEKLKTINDEQERSRRIASGSSTPDQLAQDKLDELKAEYAALQKYRDVVLTEKEPYQQFTQKELGFVQGYGQKIGINSPSLAPSDAEKEKSFSTITAYLADLRKKIEPAVQQVQKTIASANVASDKALADQQTAQDDSNAKIAQQHMQELLESSSADELRKRAEEKAKIFAEDQAGDDAEYAEKLLGLKGNLAAQLTLIQQHAQDRLATEKANAAEIDQLLQASSKKDTAQLQATFKQSGANVSQDQISGFAGQGDFAGLLAQAEKSNPNFALNDHDFKDVHERFQTLSNDLLQINALKDKVAKIGVTVTVKMVGDIKTETDKFVRDVEEESSAKLAELKASAGSGDISQRDALKAEMQVKLEQQAQLYTALAAVQDQVFQKGSDGAKAQAQSIELLRQKIASLTPTLQQQAATSNSFVVGWKLGLQEIADKTQTGAQLVGQTMSSLAQGLADSGASAFHAWATGAESASKAFKDMMKSMLLAIAETIIKALILTAILELINLIPIVGPAVVSIIGAAGLASFATNLQGAKGAAKGEIISEGTTGTADDVPRWVSKDEAIIPASSVKKAGKPFIQRLIDGTVDFGRMAAGGFVSPEYALASIATPISAPGMNRAANGSRLVDMRPTIVNHHYLNIGDKDIDRFYATAASRKNLDDHTATATAKISRHLKRRGGKSIE